MFSYSFGQWLPSGDLFVVKKPVDSDKLLQWQFVFRITFCLQNILELLSSCLRREHLRLFLMCLALVRRHFLMLI